MDGRQQERVQQLHALLVERVEMLQSSEDWQRLLDFAGRFHRYSLDNQLLIAAQHGQAYRDGRVPAATPTQVAGFRTWKSLGRSVDKGQRGYAILAPVSYRMRTVQPVDGSPRPLAQPAQVAAGDELPLGSAVLRGFTVVHVWDVSQTSGAPLPEQPRPKLLRGQAPAGLYDGLTEFLTHRGFAVCGVSEAAAIGGANGLTVFATGTVSVRADMDDAARVKTLAHETGHVLLHKPDGTSSGGGHVSDRGRAEVEAESLAYLIGSAHGLDTSGYTLPYVTAWAGTAAPAEVVRATAQRVVAAARVVLAELDTDHGLGGSPPGAALARYREPSIAVASRDRLAVDALEADSRAVGR